MKKIKSKNSPATGMQINIKYKDGRWLVNDKRLSELNEFENEFMNDFFREVKLYTAQDMMQFNAFLHFEKEQVQEMTSQNILKKFNDWNSN